ncbi:tripartite ATP-independent transporter DctM subunit [Tahibacter aquaticus]|uniref:TRAP transporter large permease protein n=1 Tax=Tahibacter aquaticus TaxID=520092 RepID=A0A4R6YRV7_9GAMM|nr:TRAP transporter large permease [Tahibacter aquaticus]TDR40698.1 tripartite ATP-independent transporter DctM subunit [Tahibacter aquaticus]
MIWLLIGVLVILAALGAPLFAILGAIALIGFHMAGQEGIAVAVEFYRLSDMPALIAIPLFTLAGYILAESKTPQRLVRLTNALVGWLPGGLAIVAVLACTLFTAFTGATGVTIIALGAVLYPALRQAQYGEKFSLGLLTASGSLGLLLVPSMPLILYGVVAQQFQTTPPVSIDALFRAGVLPCLLMVVMLGLYSAWHVRDVARPQRASAGELWAALKDAAWEIPLPFVILIGIYSGKLAASEAAAATALYVLLVTVLIRREIKLSQLPQVIRHAMVLVGGILVILGFSLALTNWLIDAEVPEKLFQFLRTHIPESNPFLFLLALNIFLLVFGMLLEGFPAIILLVPLVLPVAVRYGIDPVHLGIIFLANLQLGIFLPPLGINLYIASARFRQPVMTLVRAAVPFFLIMLAATLIITYWPGLSLWLAR